jgi:hypothetical protein
MKHTRWVLAGLVAISTIAIAVMRYMRDQAHATAEASRSRDIAPMPLGTQGVLLADPADIRHPNQVSATTRFLGPDTCEGPGAINVTDRKGCEDTQLTHQLEKLASHFSFCVRFAVTEGADPLAFHKLVKIRLSVEAGEEDITVLEQEHWPWEFVRCVSHASWVQLRTPLVGPCEATLTWDPQCMEHKPFPDHK